MSHRRGQIETAKDALGTFYLVFTGNKAVDDFIICEHKEIAISLSHEMSGGDHE